MMLPLPLRPAAPFLLATALSLPPGLPAASRASSAPAAARPNIVFILADDLGWRDLGCQGSTFYETPHTDQLAASGMRFTSAYAAGPVCSPTRASILTGKYPARLHLTDWIPAAKRGKLNPAKFRHELPLEEVTIAEALRAAGYATGFIGKWHVGGEGFLPQDQGFDLNVGGSAAGGPGSYFSPYLKSEALSSGPPGEYLTDRLAEEAVTFIQSHRDKPFLLYLSHYAVHTPLQAKWPLQVKYETKAAALPPSCDPEFLPEGEHATLMRQVQKHAVYAAMVQSLDESVGHVNQCLEQLGIADRTIVIFFSDNGGLASVPGAGAPTSNLPLRAGKGWLYEGGVREPMIVRWPGVTRPGSVSHGRIISTDFYPTMLEMAGLPLRPAQHLDGVSIVPLLEGGKLPARELFWHYPHYGNQGGAPSGSVLSGDYKLIEWFEDGRTELYNLRDDLGEKHDLVRSMPGRAAELQQLLRRWRSDVNAVMPTPNPDFRAKVAPGGGNRVSATMSH